MENDIEITMPLESMLLMRRHLIGFLKEMDKKIEIKKRQESAKKQDRIEIDILEDIFRS